MSTIGEDIKDIQRAAVAQGWTMKPTKKGLAFIPPDRTKQIVQWHGTPSYVRAIRNFLAEMRRQGFDWPPKGG